MNERAPDNVLRVLADPTLPDAFGDFELEVRLVKAP